MFVDGLCSFWHGKFLERFDALSPFPYRLNCHIHKRGIGTDFDHNGPQFLLSMYMFKNKRNNLFFILSNPCSVSVFFVVDLYKVLQKIHSYKNQVICKAFLAVGILVI